MITAVVIFFLYKLLAIEIRFKSVEFDHIHTVFPENFSISSYNQNGWLGQWGHTPSKNHWAYLVRRSVIDESRLEDYFSIGNLRTPSKILKLTSTLYFGVVARGKSYRQYIYILRYDDHVYWIESGSSISTLLQVKTISDQILQHLRVDREKPDLTIKEIIHKTNSMLIPRYSQSLGFFIFIMAGITIISFFIVVIIFHFATKEPDQYEEMPHKTIRRVTIKINILPFSMQMLDGILGVIPKGISIFSFKKLILKIHVADITQETQLKVGQTLLLKQPYIRFHFPEPKSVSIPGRKTTLKTKKVTIYLSKTQIRDLLLETEFPFKDRWLYSDI
jgi:hypothetical protein